MITLRHVQQKNASFEAILDSSQLLVKTDKGHTPLLTNVEAAKATRNTKATPKIKGRKPSAQLEPTCEALALGPFRRSHAAHEALPSSSHRTTSLLKQNRAH